MPRTILSGRDATSMPTIPSRSSSVGEPLLGSGAGSAEPPQVSAASALPVVSTVHLGGHDGKTAGPRSGARPHPDRGDYVVERESSLMGRSDGS
jgi:hypothetical protein